MRISRLGETLGALLVTAVVVVFVAPLAQAALLEPDPEPAYRGLRTDYVRTWFIFNDDVTDGILNPGDTSVTQFKNWWTPRSAHTQHNYLQRSNSITEDWSSAPINLASQTDYLKNYWMERKANEMSFYMSYSQYDNNGWKDGLYTDGKTGDVLDILKDRNSERNGYVLGWLTHTISGVNPQTLAGEVKMDVLIHKGESKTGVPVASWGGANSYSNPQVATSNDIWYKAEDNVSSTGQFHPPQFDDTGAPGTQSYDWGGATENDLRFTLNGRSLADFNEVVDGTGGPPAFAMEIKEYDRVDATWAVQAVDPTKTPALIQAAAGYIYEDSFRDRSTFYNDATDGGVVAGLSGYDNYDPQRNNWADQQVIRLDFADFKLMEHSVNKLVFWDFGASTPGAAGTQQTDPVAIEFGIDRNRTVAQGQIFYDDGMTTTYFPDNRIYIATVNIPEPGTLALCLLGGLGLLWRRRRARSA